MALVRIPDENREITDREEIATYLGSIGIDYEHWSLDRDLGGLDPEQILAAYEPEIERLKAGGGYSTADVIDLRPDTPKLDDMLGRFSVEHWHDEDEVRFIVEGRGLFHIHTGEDVVCAIEVERGDLIRVPRGTQHWFDLCGDRRIVAIRLFQDMSGWTPHYTESGVDAGYQPMCFGPAYIPAGAVSPS
jgi:1,2-dihydroxy-3-keto-5-methylthiopentene dioxygenase